MRFQIVLISFFVILGCKQKFNKEIWSRNSNQHSDNPRFEMTEDLQNNFLIKGTKSSKVFDLLNNPEVIDTTESGIYWTYSIGSNPGFHIDPYFLVVNFDSMGNLIETKVIEH